MYIPKPVSSKLRVLHVLKTLIRFSDKEHKMTRPEINKHLPSDIAFTHMSSFRLMYDDLKEFGFDIKEGGDIRSPYVYMDEKPVKLEDLQSITFAIRTNPYIESERAETLISALKPLVSIYEEKLLDGEIYKDPGEHFSSKHEDIYNAFCKAKRDGKLLRFQKKTMKYSKEHKTLVPVLSSKKYFYPLCILQRNDGLALLGWDRNDRYLREALFDEIENIKVSYMYEESYRPDISTVTEEDIMNRISKQEETPIYEGEVLFRCRGEYLEKLHEMAGPHKEPIEKDIHFFSDYVAEHVKVTPSLLNELAAIPGKRIRIIGPQKLTDAIKEYYTKTAKVLTSRQIANTFES